MNEIDPGKMQTIIGDFYERLLMRDLLGKIVPGMCMLFFILISINGSNNAFTNIKTLSIPILILLIGVSWLIAFVLQYIGETVKLLKECPSSDKNDEKETRKTFYKKIAKFHSLCKPWQKLHAERLLVIKEACGNGGLSFLLGGIFLVIIPMLKDTVSKSEFIYGLALTCIGCLLILMHRKHVDRHGIFVRNVIDRNE
jgi:hypothetical protein